MAEEAITSTVDTGAGTSAAPATASPAVGVDFMNSLDSILSGADTTEGEQPTGTETMPAVGEEEPQQEAAAAEISEDTWDPEIGAPVIENGKHQYTPEQSLALHANSRFAQELRTAIPDLTVDDAIAHDQAYTDLSRIIHDMRRGTPEGVQRFARMITKEAGQSPFASGLAAQLVDHVRQNDPTTYETIKGSIEKEIEKELYGLAAKAKTHPDKNIRDGYAQLAKLYHFHFNNGQVKEIDEYTAFDPLADRENKVREREEAIKQQDQRRVQGQVNAWQGSVKTEIAAQLSKEVDLALEPFAKKFEKNPGILKMVANAITQQVRDKIKDNSEFRERFNIKWEQGQQELSKNSAQSVIDFYIARARGILKSDLPKMLTSASSGMIEANKSRHKQLERASSASHRASGVAGAAPKQSIMQPPGKFKTPAEYAAEIDRTIQ